MRHRPSTSDEVGEKSKSTVAEVAFDPREFIEPVSNCICISIRLSLCFVSSCSFLKHLLHLRGKESLRLSYQFYP